ncbi:Uncharacterized protein dnm_063340 [Desulfonema magnum]|uniref:Uncharacterized protein n=1 Tax=Desulfonema magnum TaxID=45655 RepID=A0A975BRW9_9BACT|nr:Uncharacterized protein dnm_063340 [Desulfonema magnum]
MQGGLRFALPTLRSGYFIFGEISKGLKKTIVNYQQNKRS